MVTYRPNIPGETFASTHDAEQLLRRKMAAIALRLDQKLLNTRYVANSRRPERRLQGICFLEKLEFSPHLHCLLMSHPDYLLSPEEKLERQLLLLEYGHTAPLDSLATHDQDLLERHGRVVQPVTRLHPLYGLDRRRAEDTGPCIKSTCHVRTIYNAQGLAEYVTKEMWDGSTSFFLLNELHSSGRIAA